VTPIKNGQMKAKASLYAIKALNIQQRKEFKVNITFLNLIKERDKLNICPDMPTAKLYKDCYSEYAR